MVRAREMPESASESLPPFRVPLPTRRVLTAAELQEYDREGYVVLRGFYSTDEIDMLCSCMVADPLVMGSPMDGSKGK